MDADQPVRTGRPARRRDHMPACTVGVERSATEVASATTEETRAVFAGLPGGSDHSVR
ncbi:hypothetical protein [Streptomyces sp. NPDC050856]|uniref:hypothetical protein n=1 Tax=Streptomyces sp. NPDC050856 TaxID=3154939 RepID=UPI0033D5E823